MKSILLSTALVAIGGMAAANDNISFSGAAELGYNDNALGNDGFYGSIDLGVGFSAELDNGITAGVDFDIEFDGSNNSDLTFDDGLLYIESDTARLDFGVTSFAAQDFWTSAGDMEADGFSEASDESVLKGTLTVGAVSGALSYIVVDDAGVSVADSVAQMSLGLSADFGGVNVALAYQEDAGTDVTNLNPDLTIANGDYNGDEIFGLSLGTTLGGADLRLAYASNETDGIDSTGIKVSYPIGSVTATAYFVAESAGGDNYGLNVAYAEGPLSVALDYQDDQGVQLIGLEGSYDLGNGLTMYAGYLSQDAKEDRFYVAGGYDLGGGASLLVSYAEDQDNVDGDEIGANDYQRGTTIELTFAF